jgi:5-methyltetrahydropteroyltriglutamate--homocysteine methyltransferase
MHLAVLDAALKGIPSDRVRLHLCWGNYEGPHHLDIEMKDLGDVVLKTKCNAISFEGANPRHAHEWSYWKDNKLPDDKVLVPGVIDSTNNFVEHPVLVAQRICRFADIVGRERVLAGTDCGFGTYAGRRAVYPSVVLAKLSAMAEGARIATDRLWQAR